MTLFGYDENHDVFCPNNTINVYPAVSQIYFDLSYFTTAANSFFILFYLWWLARKMTENSGLTPMTLMALLELVSCSSRIVFCLNGGGAIYGPNNNRTLISFFGHWLAVSITFHTCVLWLLLVLSRLQANFTVVNHDTWFLFWKSFALVFPTYIGIGITLSVILLKPCYPHSAYNAIQCLFFAVSVILLGILNWHFRRSSLSIIDR